MILASNNFALNSNCSFRNMFLNATQVILRDILDNLAIGVNRKVQL